MANTSHDSTVMKQEDENTPQRPLAKWVGGLHLQQKGLGRGRGRGRGGPGRAPGPGPG